MTHVIRRLSAVSLALLSACRSGEPTNASTAKHARSAPELFGAGLFSTGAWDFFIAFTPDQRRALFGRADDAFERYAIYETRLGSDGRWSSPTQPRFAREGSNADAHLSPDGRTVYFISNRATSPGEAAPRATYDIWAAALQADGDWSDAYRLPAPVNGSDVDKWCPAVASSGDLYFGAELPGTHGGSDLWVSRRVNGAYTPPENLGSAINSSAHEVDAWIAPDESYLIFAALRRPDGVGGYDLFLSRRLDGRWIPAQLLGAGINTPQSDWNHSVSPDGKWLYFTSTRPFTGALGERLDFPRDDAAVFGIGNGKGDMYRVPMSTLGL